MILAYLHTDTLAASCAMFSERSLRESVFLKILDAEHASFHMSNLQKLVTIQRATPVAEQSH